MQMQFDFDETEVQNLKSCIFRTLKDRDVNADDMIYLLNLLKKIENATSA